MYSLIYTNNRTYRNVYISTTTVSMATKVGKEVGYKEGLPSIQPHDPLEIT